MALPCIRAAQRLDALWCAGWPVCGLPLGDLAVLVSSATVAFLFRFSFAAPICAAALLGATVFRLVGAVSHLSARIDAWRSASRCAEENPRLWVSNDSHAFVYAVCRARMIAVCSCRFSSSQQDSATTEILRQAQNDNPPATTLAIRACSHYTFRHAHEEYIHDIASVCRHARTRSGACRPRDRLLAERGTETRPTGDATSHHCDAGASGCRAVSTRNHHDTSTSGHCCGAATRSDCERIEN